MDSNQIQLISTLVVAIATVLLTIFTGGYMYLTNRMVEEMRLGREPVVIVDIELPDRRGRFTVTNLGSSPALDISFEIIKDIAWHVPKDRESGIKALPVVKHGISYLAPGRTFKYYLPGMLDLQDPNLKQPIELRIRYRNESGKNFHRNSEIDVAQYSQVLFESFKEPETEIAEAVKQSAQQTSLERHSGELGNWITRKSKKQCPMCGESIPSIAKKCSHCGEILKDIKSGNETGVIENQSS